MIDYNKLIQEADEKGAEIYGIVEWERAKKTGETLEGTTPEPNTVGLSDGDRWAIINNELAKRFENPLDSYNLVKKEKELIEIGNQAQAIVNEFNEWVKKLEENSDYTEEGKVKLYNSKRSEAEAAIKNLGDRQHDISIEIGNARYKSMEEALSAIKQNSRPSDLAASDIAYMQTILSQDNSEKTRMELANSFNYHLSALNIINAYRNKKDLNSHEIVHPLENQLRAKPSLIRLTDIRINNTGFYTYQLLRNLNNKLFLSGNEYRGSDLF